MDIGLFCVPFRLPETSYVDGFEYDMQVVKWADEYGLSEVWFGEHTTLRWEMSCSPELMIAACARETSQIRLGTGANLLPNHNPVALAHRLMQLDHMTQGRLMIGAGAGAYPTDQIMHGSSEPHAMMTEALEIIEKIFEGDGPFTYDGKFWQFEYPKYDDFLQGPYWRPLQKPHPPIAMAGLSPGSNTLRQAGAGGYMPLSFNVATDYLTGHWYKYVEGAESAGRQADRNDWRVIHNVFVADTDDEAFELAVNGAMGRTYREWMIPSYRAGGMLPIMAPELTDPDDVTPEWLAEHKWLVGSPDTVVEKLHRDLGISGGFGNLTCLTFEYSDEPEAYRRHLELLGTEVLPRVKDIVLQNQPLSALEKPAEAAPVSLGGAR